MAKDAAYREAEKKIGAARRSGAKELDLGAGYGDKKPELTELPEALGQLTQLQSLNLSRNQLTVLPKALGQLTQLRSLDLSRNQLTALPEWLGQLTQLQSLVLTHNQLTALPEWLSQLTQLQSLKLGANRLTSLPESLGQLVHLEDLDLPYNELSILPENLKRLTKLKTLVLSTNRLGSIPNWVCDLKQLHQLYLNGNSIDRLPSEIGNLSELAVLVLGGEDVGPAWSFGSEDEGWKQGNRLTAIPSDVAKCAQLVRLDLDNNPLNPELVAAYKGGLDAVKRYLREMAKGGRNRYEAKLLILGDGNEGKTCVSRALRDLPFKEQKTTHGVDVEQWKFPHPEDAADLEKEITLNIWDFEGQEISHQTHQFFLTPQALYLLVFKCRDLFLMDRAEYWLDTIRARAPQAKVAIVISQCEKRSPHVPLDRIEAQYRDMLAEEWFFSVGCENGKNIEKLQAFLQRSAAGLEFMGSPWPRATTRPKRRSKRRRKRKWRISTAQN